MPGYTEEIKKTIKADYEYYKTEGCCVYSK